MPDLTDLIERLERAGEGTRELDAAVWLAVRPDEARKWIEPERFAPDYTTRPYDLTAAMGLLKGDWHLMLSGEGKFWAVRLTLPDLRERIGLAASPALAAVSAALRAIQGEG